MAGFLPSLTGRFREGGASEAGALLDTHLNNAIAELQPQPAVAPPTEETSAMTNPASAGLGVKALMEEHTKLMTDIHNAQVQLLRATLAKQRDTVTAAIGSVARQIDSQTEDFKAIMGQFTNDLGQL